MRSQLGFLSVVFAAVLLLASAVGCNLFEQTPTPTPTPPPDIPPEVLAARDTALTFLRGRYPTAAPAAGIAWTSRNTTPPDAPGVPSYEFTSGNWLMTIWVPQIAQYSPIYEMELDNQDTGFRWTGTLSAAYVLLESNLDVNVDVLVVRDLVLDYYRENYPASAPPADLVWIGERTTPEGAVGHEWCEFVADNWSMAVDYEVDRPDQVSYNVELRNSDTDLLWRCQVNAQGEILEIREASG
jgi:hypothetical protein